jgi:hypothetical protein
MFRSYQQPTNTSNAIPPFRLTNFIGPRQGGSRNPEERQRFVAEILGDALKIMDEMEKEVQAALDRQKSLGR